MNGVASVGVVGADHHGIMVGDPVQSESLRGCRIVEGGGVRYGGVELLQITCPVARQDTAWIRITGG